MGEGTVVQLMKIVFVNDSIYAHALGQPTVVGGAERQQWFLARALAAAGWVVTVGVRVGLQPGEDKSINGVKFVGMDQGQILSAWYRLLSSERPDWWYWRCASHWWGPAVGIAKLEKVGTIFSAAFDSDVLPRRALHTRRFWWPLYAWGLSETDRILLQHDGQLSDLSSRWRAKAYCVSSIAGETVVMKPHSKRAKCVAWVGDLRRPKRPDLLIEIARSMPEIRFIVCGGPTAHRSQPGYGERISDCLQTVPNVEQRGQIIHSEALQVIADAAVLLSTSDEEGFPNTFLEAWSSGTPVVSLKIDPDRQIERLGLGVVSKSTAGAIADIHALMHAPERRDEIGLRARQHVAEAHSEAAVIAAFERAISGIRA